MGVNASYRDKAGEIGCKYGDTLIGTLRSSYGLQFARGCANNDKLSEVLAKLDERSLFKLVRDYKAGMLPIRLRAFSGRPVRSRQAMDQSAATCIRGEHRKAAGAIAEAER